MGGTRWHSSFLQGVTRIFRSCVHFGTSMTEGEQVSFLVPNSSCNLCTFSSPTVPTKGGRPCTCRSARLRRVSAATIPRARLHSRVSKKQLLVQHKGLWAWAQLSPVPTKEITRCFQPDAAVFLSRDDSLTSSLHFTQSFRSQ